jgi:hypothetical protein
VSRSKHRLNQRCRRSRKCVLCWRLGALQTKSRPAAILRAKDGPRVSSSQNRLVFLFIDRGRKRDRGERNLLFLASRWCVGSGVAAGSVNIRRRMVETVCAEEYRAVASLLITQNLSGKQNRLFDGRRCDCTCGFGRSVDHSLGEGDTISRQECGKCLRSDGKVHVLRD